MFEVSAFSSVVNSRDSSGVVPASFFESLCILRLRLWAWCAVSWCGTLS